MSGDAKCVVECLDVFKDKRVGMMEVLNPEPVKPLALDQGMEGCDARIVIRITFMTVTELKQMKDSATRLSESSPSAVSLASTP